MHTVENRTGEVTHELLQEVGLLRGDFVVAITLATALSLGGGKTGAKFSVDDCIIKLADDFLDEMHKNGLHAEGCRGED